MRTRQVAILCGIHPNTVRQYEAQGFLPRIPRGRNGYRRFAERHVLHVRLTLAAMKSTWLGGAIRRTALDVLRASASGRAADACRLSRDHLALVREERRRAEAAARVLDSWARGRPRASMGRTVSIGEAASLLDATPDMLRNWERNGFLVVPRNPSSRHRQYGEADLQRLAVVRTLRKARFSLMAILRMFRRFDAGERHGLSRALSELSVTEEDLFFSTDRWLVRIREIEKASLSMGRILTTLH
jgi:DNA-binding transcriptional MerR regulator